MSIYKLPLLLEPQPEGGYTITCPLLPNLVTEVDTLEQVIPNVADALAALIEACQELQQPLPLVLQPLTPNTTLWAETLIAVKSAWYIKKSSLNWENLVARKFHGAEEVHIASGIIHVPVVWYQFQIGEIRIWR